MSNLSIKTRIHNSILKLEKGEISLQELSDVIELNGDALESMPYELIENIREIEYQLTQCQFSELEYCEYEIESTLSFIKNWLSKIPN
ncbi:hypothetical protein [Shewanella youngdeokensis]|uniref:Uncharacterized protein n=1 Tax=Shewanella youngdeokensis TaxID=2999068 RepID=A0ABZ0JZZ0_9GAMM|nr:hypothetical protein RGE70_03280 [Shewanella sp. DAU334]